MVNVGKYTPHMDSMACVLFDFQPEARLSFPNRLPEKKKNGSKEAHRNGCCDPGRSYDEGAN